MATREKATAKRGRPKKSGATAAANRKAKHEATLRELKPIATRANGHFAAAEKALDKADDHRLAASIVMAEAEDMCKKAKLNFKEWSEDNITQSYNTVRQLLPIGRAGMQSEEKGMLMLADLRAGGKARAAKHRAAKKAAKAGAAGKGGTSEDASTRAFNAVTGLPDQSQVNLAKSVAEKHGLAVVSHDELPAKPDKKRAQKEDPMVTMQDEFLRMSAKDRMTFVKWAVDQVGGKLTIDTEADDLSIPPSLDRRPKGRRRKKAATNAGATATA